MKYKKQNVAFGPIPARAFSDMRVTWQFRVLGVICCHDRLGYNGQGCAIGRKRMATESGCGETHVSDAVSDLERWGYITVERDEVDGRKKVYRVVYTDNDWKCLGVKIENRSIPVDLSEQNRSTETADRSIKLADRSTNPPRKVHSESAKSLTDKGGTVPNILRYKYNKDSQVRDEGEEERYCAEARQPREVRWTTESAEVYLAEVQTLTPEALKWERAVLCEIADDVALPNFVRDRAASLRDAA